MATESGYYAGSDRGWRGALAALGYEGRAVAIYMALWYGNKEALEEVAKRRSEAMLQAWEDARETLDGYKVLPRGDKESHVDYARRLLKSGRVLPKDVRTAAKRFDRDYGAWGDAYRALDGFREDPRGANESYAAYARRLLESGRELPEDVRKAAERFDCGWGEAERVLNRVASRSGAPRRGDEPYAVR